MDQLYSIVPREIIEAIGWTIFHSLWQGIVVALILGIFLISFARFSAHTRYIIAFASLAIMIVWTSVTFVRCYGNAVERAEIRERIISNPTIVVEHLKESISEVNTNTKVEAKSDEVSFRVKWILFKAKLQKQFPWIVILWLTGLLFFMFRFMGGLLVVQRLKHRNILPVSECWQQLTNDFAEGLKIKKTVVLLQSFATKVPVTIGYIKPVILLPVSVYTGLSTSEIESIIAHELAHIARRDYFFNIIQSFIEILFFYHPAVWWISSVARTERENSCDDIAIELTGDSLNYAKALANLQEQVVANPDYAMAFGNNKNKLFKRVKRLLNKHTMKTTFKEGFIASCVLFTGILLVIFFTGASANQNDSSKFSKDRMTAKNRNVSDSVKINSIEPAKADAELNKEKKEVLSKLEDLEISDKVEKELEVALVDLDNASTDEVLKSVRKALNEMDINGIVQEAMKGARAAIDNMDMNAIVKESMKGNNADANVDVDKVTREAMKGASAALEEMDLNKIISEALKGAEGALDKADLEKTINKALEEELKDIKIDIDNDQDNKYYAILSQGSDSWNKWRKDNPNEMPDLSDFHLQGMSLQGADFSRLNMSDIVIEGTNLEKASLSGANVSDIVVNGSNLSNSNFENANVSDIVFTGNVMNDVNFKSVKLSDAVFSGIVFRNCDFRKAMLSDVQFNGCTFENCNFKDAVANEDITFPSDFDPKKNGMIVKE